MKHQHHIPGHPPQDPEVGYPCKGFPQSERTERGMTRSDLRFKLTAEQSAWAVEQHQPKKR